MPYQVAAFQLFPAVDCADEGPPLLPCPSPPKWPCRRLASPCSSPPRPWPCSHRWRPPSRRALGTRAGQRATAAQVRDRRTPRLHPAFHQPPAPSSNPSSISPPETQLAALFQKFQQQPATHCSPVSRTQRWDSDAPTPAARTSAAAAAMGAGVRLSSNTCPLQHLQAIPGPSTTATAVSLGLVRRASSACPAPAPNPVVSAASAET